MTGDSSSTRANQGFQRGGKENIKTFNNLIQGSVLDEQTQHKTLVRANAERNVCKAVRLQAVRLQGQLLLKQLIDSFTR